MRYIVGDFNQIILSRTVQRGPLRGANKYADWWWPGDLLQVAIHMIKSEHQWHVRIAHLWPAHDYYSTVQLS